jgi:hypothetical protein
MGKLKVKRLKIQNDFKIFGSNKTKEAKLGYLIHSP